MIYFELYQHFIGAGIRFILFVGGALEYTRMSFTPGKQLLFVVIIVDLILDFVWFGTGSWFVTGGP